MMVMEEIRTSVAVLTTKVNTILRNLAVQQEDHSEPVGVHFPLKEVIDLTDLELKLQDPEQERKIVS